LINKQKEYFYRMDSCNLAFAQYDQMCVFARSSKLSGFKKVLIRGNTAYFVNKSGEWYMATYISPQEPILRCVPPDWINWIKTHYFNDKRDL
jgi:hypothetical protein